MSKLISLSEVIASKEHKEKELEFYHKELEKLNDKMYWLRRDIDVTNIIIDMIEKENIVQLTGPKDVHE